ncbi:hypothetical protein V9T40_005052 [Parthenolecanium corni]|uniref:Transposase n=1 Tax=Parthenolecanium corni TaxID=536013 RepID=A0AAN9Y2G8_9HEMI
MARAGPINVFDNKRTGRPKLRQSDKIAQQIAEKIHNDWRITLRHLAAAAETGVDLGMVNTTIKKLGYQRICAKWVPKLITMKMKAARKAAAEQLLVRTAQIWRPVTITYSIISRGV